MSSKKKCDQILLKEFLLIITATATVFMLQFAVYSMFNEIDSFDRTLRAELEEFEIYFNLSSTFLKKMLPSPPEIRRRTVDKRYATPFGTLHNTFLQSGSMPDCPRGDSGWPGVPGFDGVPGTDGPPGLDGIPVFISHEHYGVPHLHCTVCPAGPPGHAGDRGSEGPRGPPGAAGSSAPAAYEYSVPGARGAPGNPGRPGGEGEPGRPGSPGAPGIRRHPGAPGRRGQPGHRGPAGHAGDSKPRAEKGRPGPRGIPGMEGRKGKEGAHGRNGKVGWHGHKGQDGLYCPCPERSERDARFYTILPNSVPWEDPANALTDRLARRSASVRFPKPPLFPMKPIEGDIILPRNNAIVEDISNEESDKVVLPPTPDSLASEKWADVMAKRRRKWQARSGSRPTLLGERRELALSEQLKLEPEPSEQPRYQRDHTEAVDGEITLNEIDAIPRRMARLRLDGMSGSPVLPDNSKEEVDLEAAPYVEHDCRHHKNF